MSIFFAPGFGSLALDFQKNIEIFIKIGKALLFFVSDQIGFQSKK